MSRPEFKKPDNGEFKGSTPMPWGKHEGTALQDIPAAYMFWLWTERGFHDEIGNHWNPVARYIGDNLDDLKAAYPDGNWDVR